MLRTTVSSTHNLGDGVAGCRSVTTPDWELAGMTPQRTLGTSEAPAHGHPVQERRRWQRLPLAIPIFVHGIDERANPVTEFSTTLNISAGGALLAMRASLSPSRRILIQVPAGFPKPHLPVRTQQKFPARVLRITRRDHWYLCAVAFSSPLKVSTRRIPLSCLKADSSDSTGM